MPRSYYDFSQISLKSWGKRKKYQRYFRMLFYTFFPQLFSKQLYIKYLLCVLQGFPALRKAAKTLMEKYDIFSRLFDIANQPLTRHSPFAQLRQVDEWTAKPSPFPIHGRLSQFCRIMATKTLKNHHRLKTVTSKLRRTGRKPKYEKKPESYVFSGFGNGNSRGWEQKSTVGRFATGRLWPFTWKISCVGKDKVNNW